MRKIFCVSMLLCMILSLGSCGKNKKAESTDEEVTLQLKPETTSVSGALGDCFTVVDRTYDVTLKEFLGGVITVELQRTDAPLPFSTEGRELYHFGQYSSSPYVQVGFGIEFLDENKNIVSKTSASTGGLGGPYSPDECVELVKLSDGQTGSIRFSVDDEAKKAVSFRITSAFEYGGKESDGVEVVDADDYMSESHVVTVDDDDDDDDYGKSVASSSSSKSGKNWDSLLDSYERFVDRYIPMLKKVENGTLSPTSPEYLEYMQESSKFISELGDAQGDMTSSQWSRYMKITAKLNAAARNM